nr:uncharacterized protein LOC115137416 [Oncorhynchus nerka]
MTDAMDGNLESGDVNKKRSELCYVIDDLSAQHAPNGLDHTGLSHSETPIGENSEFHHQNIHITLPADDMSDAQQWSVAKYQPQLTSPQLTPTKHYPPCQMRQPSSSISKSSHKTSAAQIHQVEGDGLCASILLACLFCQPWDCLLATGKGCHVCASSLCSSLCSTVCCCEPDSLEPLLDTSHHCGCGGCLDAHCCLCGGPGFECCVCATCIHATECLDLGMEISQMLFH